MSDRSLGTFLQVLRCEGPMAVRDRVLDRLAERRRRAAFRVVPIEQLGTEPVLVVSARAPETRHGGVALQLRWRMEAEGSLRQTALLFGSDHGLRIEVAGPDGYRSSLVRVPWNPSPIELRNLSFEQAVFRVATLLEARVIHVEGLAELPLASLAELSRRWRLLISVHDFSLFCPRPQLLEQPVAAFCHYCTDDGRCHRCLGTTWQVRDEYQRERRKVASRLLEASAATVWPSRFLLEQHAQLLPGTWTSRAMIVEPPCPATELTPGGPDREKASHRIAFLGGPRTEKGAVVLARALEALGPTRLRFVVYGGLGDPGICRQLRRFDGVRVRGYYRGGSLPGLLRRHRIGMGLLLSIVPESYSLALSECVRADVPVVAVGLGALAERVPRWKGALLPPDGVVGSLVDSLQQVERHGTQHALGGPAELALKSPRQTAEALQSLYGAIGSSP